MLVFAIVPKLCSKFLKTLHFDWTLHYLDGMARPSYQYDEFFKYSTAYLFKQLSQSQNESVVGERVKLRKTQLWNLSCKILKSCRKQNTLRQWFLAIMHICKDTDTGLNNSPTFLFSSYTWCIEVLGYIGRTVYTKCGCPAHLMSNSLWLSVTKNIYFTLSCGSALTWYTAFKTSAC